MKSINSKRQLLSTLCVAVACAIAILTAGATSASAKILKIRNGVTGCTNGGCGNAGGSCGSVNGGICACIPGIGCVLTS